MGVEPMKTFVPVSATMTSSRAIRQTGAVRFRLASKQNWLRRFQYFIEMTDWEERYICNPWIDKMCLGGLVVSAVYFTTILYVFLN
jgi:hypothetical protein